MVQALIIFGYFLGLSAITLAIFWALQIRFGDVSDLDPQNVLVRWLAKKQSTLAQSGFFDGHVVEVQVLPQNGATRPRLEVAGALLATVICFAIPETSSQVRVGYLNPASDLSASPVAPTYAHLR